MTIFATTKSKLFIGAPLAQKNGDFIAAEFTAALAAAVEIAPLEGLGQLGDTSESIPFDAINDGRRKKLKGIRDAGTMEVVIGADYNNPGVLALLAAEKTPHDYAFRIVLNNAPPGGTPGERLFIAQVMSVAEVFDTANNVVKINASLAVNSNAVHIAASVGGEAPDNTALPVITGTAEVGQTLTGSDGTWTGTPTPALARQWFADGESILGSTASTLILTEDHEGAVITFMVAASNHLGTVYATSAPTSTVAGD